MKINGQISWIHRNQIWKLLIAMIFVSNSMANAIEISPDDVTSAILEWNTFLGSDIEDEGKAIAVDSNGNIYVTGSSDKSWGNPIDAHAGNGVTFEDIFVAKYNSEGELQWNTFMGKTANFDFANAIGLDANGNIYISGYGTSDWGWNSDPVNPHSGSYDVFVAKLNSSGERQWHTYMGSSNTDYGQAMAVDKDGNTYVTGYSIEQWGSPETSHSGDWEAFAAKINSSGVRQWNTFMGSSDGDEGFGIAIDNGGNVYIAGVSDSTWGSPVIAHSSGRQDGFITKLNSSGERQWNTFLGTAGHDYCRAITANSVGNVYVTGHSNDTWGTPINPHPGNYSYSAYVGKFDTNGNRIWNTFMGSSTSYVGSHAINLDTSDNIFIAGDSAGTWGVPDLPFTAGNKDAFVAELSSTGIRKWHAFLGSSDADVAWDVAVDGSGNTYVVGDSLSTWGSPIVPHSNGVEYDAFLAKVMQSTSEECSFFLISNQNGKHTAICL